MADSSMSPEFIAILSIGATLAGTQLAAVLWLAGYVQSQANAVRAEMRSEIGGVRTELTNEARSLREEIGGVRTEVTDEIRSVRTEIGSVRTEIGSVRTEIGNVRTEINTAHGRAPHRDHGCPWRDRLCRRGETADLRERMARVEGLLEGLRDTIGNQRDIG